MLKSSCCVQMTEWKLTFGIHTVNRPLWSWSLIRLERTRFVKCANGTLIRRLDFFRLTIRWFSFWNYDINYLMKIFSKICWIHSSNFGFIHFVNKFELGQTWSSFCSETIRIEMRNKISIFYDSILFYFTRVECTCAQYVVSYEKSQCDQTHRCCKNSSNNADEQCQNVCLGHQRCIWIAEHKVELNVHFSIRVIWWSRLFNPIF